jgi:hypothetical protein
MNSAPAELLQLLTIAALQPSSSIRQTTDRLVQVRCSTSRPGRQRKEKAAMPEHGQAVRLVFFAMLTCILIESASYIFGRFAITCVQKYTTFTF